MKIRKHIAKKTLISLLLIIKRVIEEIEQKVPERTNIAKMYLIKLSVFCNDLNGDTVKAKTTTAESPAVIKNPSKLPRAEFIICTGLRYPSSNA
jgi:hypothetical protein